MTQYSTTPILLRARLAPVLMTTVAAICISSATTVLAESLSPALAALDKLYSPRPPAATSPPAAPPTIGPAPAPGVPALPKWTLVPPGKKPPIGSVSERPGLQGPNFLNLQKTGYVEEEYFISGQANVYSADGKEIVTANAPYTTAILVRRPKDRSKFSGNIIVEPARDLTQSGSTWQQARRYMMRNGDIYVIFTMAKSNLDAYYRLYDPSRYGGLSIADDGQRLDIMAQTAGMMRHPEGPLGKLGFLSAAASKKGGVKVISTGSSLTGVMQATFIDNGHHARARRPDGGPIIDGYLQLVSGRPAMLPSDAPVISLVSEGDYDLFGQRLLALPRTDSDGEQKFRWYEVAGTSHSAWNSQLEYNVGIQQLGDGMRHTAACKAPVIKETEKEGYVIARLADLEAWVREGRAPPPGQVLKLSSETLAAGAKPTFQKDEHGNSLGGIRPYWLAVPIGVYSLNEEGSGPPRAIRTCRMHMTVKPFPKEQLAGLYKSRSDYISKVSQHIKSQVDAGYLLPEDAAIQLKRAEANQVP